MCSQFLAQLLPTMLKAARWFLPHFILIGLHTLFHPGREVPTRGINCGMQEMQKRKFFGWYSVGVLHMGYYTRGLPGRGLEGAAI